jgi:hypothetical protein
LGRLRQVIQSKEAVVITGMDGIGKSTLLRQAASSEEARAMQDGTIWVDGRDENGNSLALEALIQRVFDSLYESHPPVQVPLETAHPYLSSIQALVILDEIELAPDTFSILADLFPRSAILVSATQAPSGNQFLSLQLGPLPTDDAIRLFRELAGPLYENTDVSAIASICRLLGSVPLAIVMTTNVLRETYTSLELVREVLEAAIPQSHEESAAGLERARELAQAMQEQEPVTLRERLAAAAREWERLGRDPSVLWGSTF